MRQGSRLTYLSGAVPCCVHSLFNPFQLASEPAETRFVGPSTLTNGPLFSPHFPWCFGRIPSHAPYFSEPSLRSPPLHQSPLSSPTSVFFAGRLSPPEGHSICPTPLCTCFCPSVCLSRFPPTTSLSVSQSLFLSRCLLQSHHLICHPEAKNTPIISAPALYYS